MQIVGRFWDIYHVESNFITWSSNLLRGVQIYHVEFKFITWSSNLSRRVQIYHVEFKFITWSSNLSRGVQFYHVEFKFFEGSNKKARCGGIRQISFIKWWIIWFIPDPMLLNSGFINASNIDILVPDAIHSLFMFHLREYYLYVCIDTRIVERSREGSNNWRFPAAIPVYRSQCA